MDVHLGGKQMYIATNRFQIQAGREEEFEKIWRERDSHLNDVAGFKDFKLLRGPTEDGATLYVSHSVWDSAAEFEDWTKSEAFRKAHGGARSPAGLVMGHPRFEGLQQVL